jgi:peptidoglycan/LPS O-acetylase OafA/YrhL
MVAVVTTIGLVVTDYASPTAALVSLTYASNWFQAFGITDLGALGHTWSLSIEEQFYLAWPLVMLTAMRSRHWRGILYATTAVAWTYALVARFVLLFTQGHNRVYSGTDLRMDALLVGCSLAIWMTTRPTPAAPTGRWWLAVDGLLVGVLAAQWWTSDANNHYLLIPAWWPLVVVVLIRWCVTPGYGGLLTRPVLRYVGQRSYGLYLWHVPVLLLMERTSLPHLPTVAVAYALSLLVTEVSWRYVEQPFVRIKGRLAHPEPLDGRTHLVHVALVND